MDLDSVFMLDNLDLIFEEFMHEGEFIAQANDTYSGFGKKDDFGFKWIQNFPFGRYVIIIYQRHSLYANGKQIFLNTMYDNSVGSNNRHRMPGFVLILDQVRDYSVATWNRQLVTHTVCNTSNPLQAETYWYLEDAEAAACKYSRQGYKVALMEWFEDYDMF